MKVYKPRKKRATKKRTSKKRPAKKRAKKVSKKGSPVYIVFGNQGCPFGGSHSLTTAKGIEKKVSGKTSVHRVYPTDTYAKILKKQGINITKWK